jgi:CHAT domain-containing protein
MEAESFYLLAISEKNLGNLDKAILNVSRGLEIVEAIRGELIGSEVRYAYFSTVQNYYELYIDLLISNFEKTNDKTHIAKGLEISERSRSRSLIELLRQANVNFKQGIDADLLAKFQTSQSLLNDKYNARQRLLSETPTAEQVAKINDEIKNLTEQTEKLRLELRKNNPKFADLTEGKTVSAAEIQNLLDEKTVLIEYKLGEKRSFLWLVTKNTIDVFVLPSRRQIEDKANVLYSLITADNPNEKVLTAKTANELSNILLAPIAEKINGKRLAIVAEGTLQYLPFSALPVPNAKEKILADENEIVVLPSASVLAQIRENSVQNRTFNKTIAIFADPVFDEKDTRIKRDNSQKIIENKQFTKKLPRLIASRQEALNISNFAEKTKINLQTDFAANIENVADKNLSDYRILHFATHGFLDTAKPAESGLLFSLYDEKGVPQNGFLNLDGIYNLNISSDLVVLSACQTALGKDIRGEGLIGLSRGFLYAGSKQIVASLWKVDDSATAEFMRLFYRNHLEKNMPAAAALRQAKLEMKKIPRYKSPFYWGAFTLLGDWR